MGSLFWKISSENQTHENSEGWISVFENYESSFDSKQCHLYVKIFFENEKEEPLNRFKIDDERWHLIEIPFAYKP